MTEAENRMKNVIVSKLGRKEIWVQMAEESAELSQAAIKMHRLYEKRNQPRKAASECVSDVIEEIADVMLCIELIGWDISQDVEIVKAAKLRRWFNSVGGYER